MNVLMLSYHPPPFPPSPPCDALQGLVHVQYVYSVALA